MQVQNMGKVNADSQFQKFKYKQIQSLKIQFLCSFFALDPNSAILFAGQNLKGVVKAFALNSQPKLIKTLISIKGEIDNAIFIGKSKQMVYVPNNIFVRKTQNQIIQIVISKLNQNFQLTAYQDLQAHNNKITSLLPNESEDLLISGSIDRKIKFWKKDNLSWSHLQTIDAQMDVSKLSFNVSVTKLIATDSRVIIKIFELQPNQNWIIYQTIQCGGKQLCFINDNQFVVQSLYTEYMAIYNYDEQEKQYIQSQKIYLSKNRWLGFSFPPQYIKEKNILIVKQPGCVIIFGIDQKGNYIEQQTNEYDIIQVDGKVTNNGRFLITVLGYSQQFYLSKYQSIE